MSRCPARPVARWAAPAPAWAAADPVRRRSSSIAAASTPAWRSCASRSRASRRPARPSAPTATATRCRRVAIAGYTNAGKSSLLNRITQRRRARRERAVRDPRRRRCARPRRPTAALYTLTDTVGFVRNLPHQLVEAFRSTLEEVGDSDVIVHVVDASHPDPASQLATVRDVIGEVGARDIPEIVVFNKARPRRRRPAAACCAGSSPTRIFVSARTGEGIDELLAAHRASCCRIPTSSSNCSSPTTAASSSRSLHDHGTRPRDRYDESGTARDRPRARSTQPVCSPSPPRRYAVVRHVRRMRGRAVV